MNHRGEAMILTLVLIIIGLLAVGNVVRFCEDTEFTWTKGCQPKEKS